ncbi:MAG: c-type cytochrome [Balneolales bacterium]
MRKPITLLIPGAIIIIGALFFSLNRGGEETLGASCLSLYESISKSPGVNLGETDYETYADLKIPPLHPDEALERFDLEEGFRIEVVAHEPMVIDPVAMDIDADGRLWVVNMPSYNLGPVREILSNTGERTEEREKALREQLPDEPLGSVVVLEDTDGDGKMDTKRVFYDGVHLPRSIKVLKDGILLGEPPNLSFIQDTNGDGKGDTREVISDEYTTPRSVQGGPSALHWSMDNWMHNGRFPSLRRLDGEWQTKEIGSLGQFGVAQDNWGRLYSSSNSWPLQTHLVPYGYSNRHLEFDVTEGLDVRIAPNEPVWPAHASAVNRGYRVGVVTREDGTLKIGAGISSTVIYRGGQFGDEYVGNAFTPIAGGNLIKRMIIDSDPAEIEAEAEFAYEGDEFLTSTDERFRPVNIYNAPDGSIYVVDLYRGLYDYMLWVTEYLKEYTLENGLDVPSGKFGRIYRIVRDDREIDYNVPKFSQLTPTEAAAYLKHDNGQLRDQAQQVLVQCSPEGVIPMLEEIVANDSEEGWTRIQALWTLDGFDRSTYSQEKISSTALNALNDSHPRVRSAAIRILEPALADNSEEVLARLETMTEEEQAPYVQLQLLASLGESDSSKALELIAAILDEHAESPYFREMALTGVNLREDEMANLLRNEYGWNDERGEDYATLLTSLAEAGEEPAEIDLSHLSEAHLELYNHGKERYAICAVCHGNEGQGISGMGATLAGSDWVQSDPEALGRIVLQGFDGASEERGENIPNNMPGHAFLSDEDLAGILTYIRQSWGNDASPIEPEEIARIREASSGRTELWSPDELREEFN